MHLLIPRLHGAVLLLVCLCCLRCAREIIIDLPVEPPLLVANCHFSDDQPFRVKVTTSQPVNGTGDPITPEAIDITISEDGKFLDKLFRAFTEEGELLWKSRDTARVGKRYSLFVRVSGYPNISASSALPTQYELEPMQVFPEDIDTVGLPDGRYELRIPLSLRLADVPATQRYFAFRLSHTIGVYSDFSPPAQLDYIYEPDSTFFLADGRTLSLLHNISEPVVLVNENFWNEDRRTLNLVARIPFDPKEERPLSISIQWRTLSEEFYRYHLSLARQGSSLPLSEPDAVFNNIDGGYGNFSGYLTQVLHLELPHP